MGKTARPAARSTRRPRSRKTGLPPGSLIHVGERKTDAATITLLEFDAEGYAERRFGSIAESRSFQPARAMLWLNVYGLHEPEVMAEIGRRFRLHPLVLEDILNTDQRPKVDDYGEYLYVVTRLFSYDAQSCALGSDQISLVIGHNFVLSFQERPSGCFDPVRERLRSDKSAMRTAGADYLAYCLLDAVADRHFVVIDQMSERIERSEEQLAGRIGNDLLADIHAAKRDLVALRRGVWPMRELVGSLQRTEARFFTRETQLYLRDIYDHTVHAVESLDTLRDLVGDLLDLYMSTLSHRLNLQLRLLTVITVLFMPATLISGIFGMNFQHMPWLAEHDGFYWALMLMGAVAVVLAGLFWRRNLLR